MNTKNVDILNGKVNSVKGVVNFFNKSDHTGRTKCKPIDLERNFNLFKCKAELRLPKIKPRRKGPGLNRKQKQAIGLYNIPKKSVKYVHMLGLHNAWQQYMQQYLNINKNFGGAVPGIGDKKYAEFSALMLRMEFQGSKLTVVRSSAPQYVGINGICIIETMKCFSIVGKDDTIRVVPKDLCVFRIESDDMEITLFGKNILTRPQERSIKKMKQRMFADL